MTMGLTIRKSSATFGLYLACIALCYPVLAEDPPLPTSNDLALVFAPPKGELERNASFNCSVSSVALQNATVEFLFNNEPVSDNRTKLTEETVTLLENPDPDGKKKKKTTFHLTLFNVTYDDEGDYVCRVKAGNVAREETKTLNLHFDAELVDKTKGPLECSLNGTDKVQADIFCLFKVYMKPTDKEPNVMWFKKTDKGREELLAQPNTTKIGLNQINSTYGLSLNGEDSGIYICEIYDTVNKSKIAKEIEVIVYAPPKIKELKVIAINKTELYTSWIVHNYNSPIVRYEMSYRSDGVNDGWIYVQEKVGTQNNSFVIKGLRNSTNYQVKLEVTTKFWTKTDHKRSVWTRTLDEELVFVPNISLKGFSATSVTIGWQAPDKYIAHLIHYYILEGRKKDVIEDPMKARHPLDDNNLPFIFGDLDPHSTYIFRVRACSEYTRTCGPWSESMEAATLDVIPGSRYRSENLLCSCSCN